MKNYSNRIIQKKQRRRTNFQTGGASLKERAHIEFTYFSDSMSGHHGWPRGENFEN